MKTNKKFIKKIFISYVLVVLPILIGILLWEDLPDSMMIHFSISGDIDGYGSKSMVVYGIPIFLVLIHTWCVLDYFIKNKQKKKKSQNFIIWISPFTSIYWSSLIYICTLIDNIDVSLIVRLSVCIFIYIFSIYFLKCKPNNSVGIRVPWIFYNEEIWEKTHFFAGILWILGGLIMTIMSIVKNDVVFVFTFVVIVILPIIYSYDLYKKNTRV